MTSVQFTLRRSLVISASWLIIGLLLLQTMLLTFRLADQSMWTDEGYTAFLARLDTPGEALAQIRRIERRPPAQFMSIWFWSRLAGSSDFSLKYFSVICTLMATALTFKLGKRVLSQSAGLWSALFMVTAPTLILYGRMKPRLRNDHDVGTGFDAGLLECLASSTSARLAGLFLLDSATAHVRLHSDGYLGAHLLYALTQWRKFS